MTNMLNIEINIKKKIIKIHNSTKNIHVDLYLMRISPNKYRGMLPIILLEPQIAT